MTITGRLDGILERYREIEQRLADPAVHSDLRALQDLGREEARLRPIVERHAALVEAKKQAAEARQLLEQESDPEMLEMIREEVRQQDDEVARIEGELPPLLIPPDPNDDRPVIVEIRGGAGGDESNLFAADLFRMFQRYATARKWPIEVLDQHSTEGGGFNKVTFEVQAAGAYSRLKFESGVHRVQRVPATEAQGRIHTSTASVAVLPEPDEVEVDIRDEDLDIDVYRATGHGGQSVNTTDSAVRITHRPSGLVVTCQDEKSQLKNKNKAMKELAARLYDRMLREQQDQISAERRAMVGTGERSEKIRTYNFKENRISDERLDGPIYKLDALMAGDMDIVIDPLLVTLQAKILAGEADGAGT
jgi:peptide chain release factor 1